MKSIPVVVYTIHSNVNTKGHCAHDKHHTINGRRTEGETKLHINLLELTAIKSAIFYLISPQVGMKHVRVVTDNITGISYINRQWGARSILCINMTTEIWEFCVKRGIRINCTHSREGNYNRGSSIKRIPKVSCVDALFGSFQISGGIIPVTGY